MTDMFLMPVSPETEAGAVGSVKVRRRPPAVETVATCSPPLSMEIMRRERTMEVSKFAAPIRPTSS